MVNTLSLFATIESWPIAGAFTISRGAKTQAQVVVAEITDGNNKGRGECVPYARYGETPETAVAALEAMRPALAEGLDRAALQSAMPAGAARNALDCAFWDLEAKRRGKRAHELAGFPEPTPCVTAYTISLGTPDTMAAAAAQAKSRGLLKIKLGGDDSDGGDSARIAAVRRAAPDTTLIVDANEGWSEASLAANFAACAQARVNLIEQPLPEGRDSALAKIKRPIPVCADESARERAGFAALTDRYDAINIKLDKAGGLTEALAMAQEAERLGLDIMVGCMVATSLATAPAILLAQRARYVDLDGPLLLARDREPGLRYAGSEVFPPPVSLWG
ncbi:MAG: dipeptide epimerase [Pseudolabrys sp.]|nr:dipeptide epimerase [Pseudolabrys sp.]